MIFAANKYYRVTYKDGETVTFKVLNSTTVFYLTRAMDIDTGEGTFLYKLLEKEWSRVEEIEKLS